MAVAPERGVARLAGWPQQQGLTFPGICAFEAQTFGLLSFTHSTSTFLHSIPRLVSLHDRINARSVHEKPHAVTPHQTSQHDRTMTSHEPTLPLGNRVFHRPPSRTASQTFHQTPPRSWPRQNITQTPNAAASPRDVSEPAFKKQKVDDTAKSLGKGTGRDIAELSFDQTIGTRGALPVVAADNKNDNESKKERRIHQPPLLPRRPVRHSYRTTPHHGRALAIERAARRDVVLTKPYVPEPPSFAPRFHDAGTYAKEIGSRETR